MLFNSYAFLLGFFPLALAIYCAADHWPWLRIPTLVLLSLVFYGYWDVRFVPLLIGSILINWLAAQLFIRVRQPVIIVAAISANLLVLAFFKYWNFLAGSLGGAIHDRALPHLDLALPLGISFFTFHHIMYLVDLRKGKAPPIGLGPYALYICFFPQVLSGPLVRWSEVLDQFGRSLFAAGWQQRWALGATLIVLGLVQKCLISDQLAQVVSLGFDRAVSQPIDDGSAWGAVLSFSFQIFFDFSGYSDIAIGLGLIFGIALPINFDAPYRATSIRDFWRRWHMTLSRFLRDYVYIPLGGNRHGPVRQIAAILVTMALAGLWHGAGWTFVIWGLLHGAALVAVLLWSRFMPPLPRIVGWILTFAFVTFTWIFFRAATFTAAYHVAHGLLVLPHDADGFRTIGIAAFCALVLPASYALAKRLTAKPRIWSACLLAILGIVVLAQLGRDSNHEFVYFRF